LVFPGEFEIKETYAIPGCHDTSRVSEYVSLEKTVKTIETSKQKVIITKMSWNDTKVIVPPNAVSRT
jgi:hypothetical protein